MLSLLTIFVSAFVVGLSGAIAPGPVLTVTISETLKRGFQAGPLIVLGHAILEIILLALIALGLGPFFEHPTVTLIFLTAGGLVHCISESFGYSLLSLIREYFVVNCQSTWV